VLYTAGTTITTTTVPAALPATLFVYASSPGRADSVVRTMTYRPAAVASVQMTPNGGGVYLGDGPVEVVLTTATEGAVIYYSLVEANVDGTLKYEVYTPGVTKISLTPGFGTLTVSAYGNLDSLWAKRTPESGAALCQAMLRGITLKHGESFAGRVIYGFDHLYSPDEPESQEPSPFSVFL